MKEYIYNTTYKTLKGLLFYITIISLVLTVLSIDSLYDKGYLFIQIPLLILLVFICSKIISKKDVKKLLFVPDNLEE